MIIKKMAVHIAWIALIFPGTILATDDVMSAIQAQNQLYMDAYRSNDVDAIIALHTHDATVIAPKYPPARGHDEIHAALVEELALGDGVLEIQAIEVTRMDGETAYEIGQYKLRIDLLDGDVFEEEGNTLLIWKLGEDSVWRIHVDMWNTSHVTN
jgi:ketosteroid isomerase-like protein